MIFERHDLVNAFIVYYQFETMCTYNVTSIYLLLPDACGRNISQNPLTTSSKRVDIVPDASTPL